MDSKPEKFVFEIGGYDAASFKFELVEDDLIYEEGLSSAFFGEGEPCNLSDEDWMRFKKVLEEVKVWDWEEYYDSPVCDGTQWSIEIQWDRNKVESSGSNAYPDSKDLDAEVTVTPFDKLSNTLEEITGKDFY